MQQAETWHAVQGNDPTIFSWNLINEGRCETSGCTPGQIQVRCLAGMGQSAAWHIAQMHDLLRPLSHAGWLQRNRHWIICIQMWVSVGICVSI